METSAEPPKSPERQTLTAEGWAAGAGKGFAQDPMETKGDMVRAKPVLSLRAALPPCDFAVRSRPSDMPLQLLGPQATMGRLDVRVREEGRPSRCVTLPLQQLWNVLSLLIRSLPTTI